MGQLFPPYANTLAKVSLCILAGCVLAAALLIYVWIRSPYTTKVNIVRDQPVPFSHKHHVDGLGIDCRFCHLSAEKSSFAGMPATETCMHCHSVIWKDSPMLARVRESFQTGTPLVWNRVHVLPGHVYFDHSIHVQKGIACVTCHGQVDQMPLVRKTNSLYMEWCLACHRHPESFLRPREEIYNMGWTAPEGRKALQEKLSAKYKVQNVTNCYACHR